MVSQITEGISVSVETFYQFEHSNPLFAQYLFAYRITIENLTEHPIKLLRRKWLITESNGMKRTVEGEGVIGEQPVILPGKTYQYVSAANLKCDMGKMAGQYEMQNLYTHKKVQINIPEFQLIAPFKMN
jgi:ApaG protein